MLVLSRHRDEKINIGDDVEIIVVEIRGDKVRLGINAPSDVPVHRHEVYAAIQEKEGTVSVGQSHPDRSAALGQLEGLANRLRSKLASESKELNWLVKTIDLWLTDLQTAKEAAK
jgi:carbon storage regulator